MPGYRVREIEHAIGGHPHRLRVLSDTQQFPDPDGHSARFGRLLAAQGFDVNAERCPMNDNDPPPHRGRMLHFRREAHA